MAEKIIAGADELVGCSLNALRTMVILFFF